MTEDWERHKQNKKKGENRTAVRGQTRKTENAKLELGEAVREGLRQREREREDRVEEKSRLRGKETRKEQYFKCFVLTVLKS